MGKNDKVKKGKQPLAPQQKKIMIGIAIVFAFVFVLGIVLAVLTDQSII